MTSKDNNNNDQFIEDTEAFRDQIATVDQEGKRIWIYPKKPSGRFYRARTWVSFAFLALFLVMPFIKVNGEPFVLFNILFSLRYRFRTLLLAVCCYSCC